MSRLTNIGFEIEGEWSDALIETMRGKGEMKGDGSLHPCVHIAPENKHPVIKVAEYNSRVYNIAVDLPIIKLFFDELQKEYDAGNFHFNKTCGFHIHTSYDGKLPVEIFSEQFTQFFLKGLRERQKRVMKLRKNNKFCKTTIPKEEIENKNHDHRYRFINLWPAFKRHGTVEFRIFPTNEPRLMYRNIVFTIGMIKKFLKQTITVSTVTTINIGEPYVADYNFDVKLRSPEVFDVTNDMREQVGRPSVYMPF